MNILMILTSHDALENIGKKTGFWLEEFAAPYYFLSDAGAKITLASPQGGQPPLDPQAMSLTPRPTTRGATRPMPAHAPHWPRRPNRRMLIWAGNPPGPLPPIALKVPPGVLQNLARQFL